MDTYKLTIKNPSKHTLALLQLLRTDESIELEAEDISIPQPQVNETRRRLDLIEKGEITTRSWDEAKKDVFK